MNYFTILDFMVKDLKLSGNELLIYALIYGFSQDGDSEFKGSINYLSERIGACRKTTQNTLNSLLKKGLIDKKIDTINNVTFNRYKAKKIDKTTSTIPTSTTPTTIAPATNTAPVDANTEHSEYTLESILNTAQMAGVSPEVAEKFYYHYASQGWIKPNGLKINIHYGLKEWHIKWQTEQHSKKQEVKPAPLKQQHQPTESKFKPINLNSNVNIENSDAESWLQSS